MEKCSIEKERQMNKIIGQKIKALKEEANMTSAALTQKLGITENRVHRYLGGYRGVSIPLVVIKECSKIFGVPFTYFFE
jgi:transcriptional regulator with XRE-family HTH domain